MRSTSKSAMAPAPITAANHEAVRSLGRSMTGRVSESMRLSVPGANQGEAAPCHPAVRVRIELDAALTVEDHDGTVGGGIGGPVVARHPGAAERPPTPLHLVAHP